MALKIFLLAGSLNLIIFSCVFPSKQPDCPERPLTQAEHDLVKKLSANGCEVSITRPNWIYRPSAKKECDMYDNTDYMIRIDNEPHEHFKDSALIRTKARELAVLLYSNVIEDSVRYFIPTIQIWLRNITTDSVHKEKMNYQATFAKKDIEKYLGYKLIIQNGKFSSKSLSRSDMLPIKDEEW